MPNDVIAFADNVINNVSRSLRDKPVSVDLLREHVEELLMTLREVLDEYADLEAALEPPPDEPDQRALSEDEYLEDDLNEAPY